MPMRKCASTHILTAQPHIVSLIHEAAEGHRLGQCPVYALTLIQTLKSSGDVRLEQVRMNCLQIYREQILTKETFHRD